MAAPDKAQLTLDVAALRAKVAVAERVEADAARQQGRPFDRVGFFAGEDVDRRFPYGPAFEPYSERISFGSLTRGVSFRDWALMALGAGFFYTKGFEHGAYAHAQC